MKYWGRHLFIFWIYLFRLWRWRRSPEQPGLEGLLVNIIIIMTIDHCDNTMIMLSSCDNTMIMLSWLGITWQYYFLSLCLYAFCLFSSVCLLCFCLWKWQLWQQDLATEWSARCWTGSWGRWRTTSPASKRCSATSSTPSPPHLARSPPAPPLLHMDEMSSNRPEITLALHTQQQQPHLPCCSKQPCTLCKSKCDNDCYCVS